MHREEIGNRGAKTFAEAKTLSRGIAARFPLLLLCVVCGAQLMVALDLSIVNVALPAIRRGLGFSPHDLQWVVSAYSLAFGGFLLLAGRAGDVFGRRSCLLLGALLFALASLLGGLAVSPGWLIGTRFMQGVGAAFLSPNALALLTTTFEEGPARSKAFGMVGAVMSSGVVLGNVAGGLLTAGPGWRWVLLINVPLLLVISVLALLVLPVLPTSPLQRRTRRLDVPGALLITLSLMLLVAVLSEGNILGWFSAGTAGLVLLACLLLMAFVVVESRVRDPLIRLALLRRRSLAAANLITVLAPGTYGALLFLLTLYLQEVLHFSALSTGVALIPLELALALTINLVPRLLARGGIKPVLVGAALAMIVGLLLMLRIRSQEDYPGTVLPALLTVGLGIGALFNATAVAATAGVPDEEQGSAVGLMSTSQQMGNGLLLALTTTIAQVVTTHRQAQGTAPVEAVVAGFQAALLAAAGVMVLVLIIALVVNWSAEGDHASPRRGKP
ncbi:MAG: MFS transporter [Ktedonobacteraceae bacterium]|nr:MFS transporter [Ktedonobacteraceae bacterium]